VIAWAQSYRAELLLVDDDHPLRASLPVLRERFARLLDQLEPRRATNLAALLC